MITVVQNRQSYMDIYERTIKTMSDDELEKSKRVIWEKMQIIHAELGKRMHKEMMAL